MSFHKGTQGSRIVQIHAGTNSVPADYRELHRLSGLFGDRTTSQCLAERIFDDGRQLAALEQEQESVNGPHAGHELRHSHQGLHPYCLEQQQEK